MLHDINHKKRLERSVLYTPISLRVKQTSFCFLYVDPQVLAFEIHCCVLKKEIVEVWLECVNVAILKMFLAPVGSHSWSQLLETNLYLSWLCFPRAAPSQ